MIHFIATIIYILIIAFFALLTFGWLLGVFAKLALEIIDFLPIARKRLQKRFNKDRPSSRL